MMEADHAPTISPHTARRPEHPAEPATMSVFIGYRHDDYGHALRVRKHLRRAGIEVRMDVLDFESLSTLHVTETVTGHVRGCTHLMLILSRAGAWRWWIPFAVGEASALDRRVCFYQVGDEALPEYLEHWPILSRPQQLDFLIEAYHREAALKMPIRSASQPTDVRAMDIHRGLRERIGRGF
jgi:hypothetical protein